MKELIRSLNSALIQLLGNKRYMSDIENMLNRLDDNAITPSEKQAIRYLIQDLRQAEVEKSRSSRRMF